MQVIPRREMSRMLRAAGLDPHTREFPDACATHRLTVRECNPPAFTHGPHRKIIYPDGRIEGPFPVGDRPALSAFVAAVFDALAIRWVLAVTPEGAFWLNNRAQKAYLARVPDAQRVCRFLRRRGLTDRFRGGFCIQMPDCAATLPLLAANTFSGGADVLFASIHAPNCRLTILACHHFDLHICTPHASLLPKLSALASTYGLSADALVLPDLPEVESVWS